MDDFVKQTKNRKNDHIEINLTKDVDSSLSSGFDKIHFEHNPMPEIDMDQIEMKCQFLGRTILAPLMISSMTGGTPEAQKINIHLALGAQERGIPLALGSGRAGLDSDETARSYDLRKYAPDIPIYANLGAIQLNNGCEVEDCKKVVAMAKADALILHFNPLQEALQPEGQTNFAGLAKKIEKVCTQIGVPVIAKEVGWGIPVRTARHFFELGVSCIDVAGAGGTSWSQVEKYRNTTDERIRISSDFRDWGIPTALAVRKISEAIPGFPIISSGGIRKGLDVAKSLASGADICGMAGKFLQAGTQSETAVIQLIDEILLELRIAMFALGAANLKNLHDTPLHLDNNL